MDNANLSLPGTDNIELPILVGTENEKAFDITKLRGTTGYTTIDNGFGNTTAGKSSITFLNGEQGILRYRGYSIEELCEKVTFTDVIYLLIYGELPTPEELSAFKARMNEYSQLNPQQLKLYDACPKNTHPMALIGMMIGGLSGHYSDCLNPLNADDVEKATAVALGQIIPIFASAYCHNTGKKFVHEQRDSFAATTLAMMFGDPPSEYKVDPDIEKIIDELLILHADHEFNCSTSTVRVVASSQANLFASLSAGVSALWGPLHGGANQKVVEMLKEIEKDGGDCSKFIKLAKDKSH